MTRRLVLHRYSTVLILCPLLLAAFTGIINARWVHAEQLESRKIVLDNARPGAITEYTVQMTPQNTAAVGSMRVQFCANSPLLDTPCTAPPGLDVSAIVLGTQSGMTGFTVHPSTTINSVVLTRSPSAPAATVTQVMLGNIVNPRDVGTFFDRLETFSSSDASGARNDYGGVALSTTTDVTVSTYVPPYMMFCVGTTIAPYDCTTAAGSYIDFGELSTTGPKYGSTQLLLSTNAGGGYNIHVLGTTLTSGNNVIPALDSPNVSRPGVSQFGINVRANRTPAIGADVQGPGSGQPAGRYNQPDFFAFASGDMIASSVREDDYRLYTVSALVNRSVSQPPGVYVSTLTFVATATF